MSARKWILMIILSLVAVVAARVLGVWAAGLFSSPQSSTPQPQSLVFAEEDLTFGPVPEGEQIERELRLTNTTTEPVTVERFEKSCTCLGIEPAGNFTVPPNGTTILRIKLKSAIPTGAKLSAEGLFSESVSLDAVVTAQGDVGPQRISTAVRFTIRQTIRFDAQVVQLGMKSCREPVTVKTTVTLLPPINEVRVLPHPDWAVRIISKGEGMREITATPTRPGEVRVMNDPLQVIPVGTDGEDRPALPLTIRGEICQDIQAIPSVITFGNLVRGATAEESFRVSSMTSRKFEVIEVSCDTGDVRAKSDPDLVKSYSVIVTPEVGDQNRQVRIKIRQDDGNLSVVVVPVLYRGNVR